MRNIKQPITVCRPPPSGQRYHRADHTDVRYAHMTAPPLDHAQQQLLALQQRIHAFNLDSAAEHELDIQDPAGPLWAALQERMTVAPL